MGLRSSQHHARPACSELWGAGRVPRPLVEDIPAIGPYWWGSRRAGIAARPDR
jgi:hypothetical protein